MGASGAEPTTHLETTFTAGRFRHKMSDFFSLAQLAENKAENTQSPREIAGHFSIRQHIG
jgi:hypothetical protein